MKIRHWVVKLAHTLVVLLTPVLLGFATITWLVSLAYPQFEYGRPDFPPDPHGLTDEARLDLALVGVAYLQSDLPAYEVIHLLQEQVIPGIDQPLYTEVEIGHMLDVKNLTDAIRRYRLVAGVSLMVALFLLLGRPQTRRRGYQAIMQGGLATSVILVTLAGFIVFGWSLFFVAFHEILFPPGTWTFDGSSGLIRLFPERFWFDFGMLASTAVLVEGLCLALLGFLLLRPNRPGRHMNPVVEETAVSSALLH